MKLTEAAAGRRRLMDELRAALEAREISASDLTSMLGSGWSRESVERVLTREEELTAKRYCALWLALAFLARDRAFGLRRRGGDLADGGPGEGMVREIAHDARPFFDVAPPDPEHLSIPDPPEKIMAELQHLLDELCEIDLPLFVWMNETADGGGALQIKIREVLARKN